MGNICTCDKDGQSKDSVGMPLEVAIEAMNPTNKVSVQSTEPISAESKMATKMDERLNQQIDHYYNMNHKNRGLAVIFNHEEFDDSDWSVRYGTRVDCDNLKTTFTALNFNVRVHEDQTKSEMKNILQNVAAEDHSDNDCLVVILLTHGELLPKNVYNPAYNSAVNEESNTILSHDLVSYIRTKDTRFALQKVFKYFTDKNCFSLANKPRLFFVQACQGAELDKGVELHRPIDKETEMDSSPYKLKPSILPHEDFFIAYASLPGFASFRNNVEGSWFIQALCKELNQFKYQYDLMQIMTLTCQTVAYEFESKSIDPTIDKMKQMPCTQSMLTKLVLFKEKQLLSKLQETYLQNLFPSNIDS